MSKLGEWLNEHKVEIIMGGVTAATIGGAFIVYNNGLRAGRINGYNIGYRCGFNAGEMFCNNILKESGNAYIDYTKADNFMADNNISGLRAEQLKDFIVTK